MIMDELFVGREKELRDLNQQLEEALNYRGRLVMIRGETGVGKTKLSEEFIRQAAPRNVRIVVGRAVRDDANPYAPYNRIVENTLAGFEFRSSWIAKLVDPEIVPFFIKLFPRIRENYPVAISDVEPEAEERSTVLRAFDRFFENLAKYKPLVMILDDCQWLAPEAVEVMKYLSVRVTNRPVLIIGTTRPFPDDSKLGKAMDQLFDQRLAHLVELKNLSAADTKEYLNRRFGSGVRLDFTNWLFQMTQGNPLFISEIINALHRQNIIRYDDSDRRWLVTDDFKDFPLSPTVESVIKYRIGNLSPAARSALQAAAVVGDRFETEMVRALLPVSSRAALTRLLNILLGQNLITGTQNSWEFTHPLIRELIYQKIDPILRRRLHRRLGGFLKKTTGKEEPAVYHLTRDLMPSDETPQLARYLLAMSRIFLGRFDNQSAWNYLKLAEKIFNKKIRVPSRDMLAVKAELYNLTWLMGRDVPPIDDILIFIRQLESSRMKREAISLYRMLFHRALSDNNLDRAEKYLTKALTSVRGDKVTLWGLKAERCLLKRRQGRFDEAEVETRKLIDQIGTHLAPNVLYKAQHSLGMIAYLKGDFQTAHRHITEALRITEDYGLHPFLGDAYANLGLIEMETGQLDSALEKLNRSVREAEITQRLPASAIGGIYLGFCYLHKGDAESALRYFENSIAQADAIRNARIKAVAMVGKARLFLDFDQLKEAEDVLTRISADDLDKGSLCDLGFMQARLFLNHRDFVRAEAIAKKSLALAEKFKFPTRVGRAIAEIGLIQLGRNQKGPARISMKKALDILRSCNLKSNTSMLLIRFGLAWGGREGEDFCREGLEMLKEMRAIPRIKFLIKPLKERGFANAFRHAREIVAGSFEEKVAITAFGCLTVKKPGELEPMPEQNWPSRKAKELLGLLIVLSDSRNATREKLASSLWPELNDPGSKANFRVTLTRLNQALEYPVLRHEGQIVCLDPDKTVVDAWEFERLFKEFDFLKRQAKLHPAEDRARRALAYYKGDLLPEFYVGPISDKQRELKEKAKDLLSWLAGRCQERWEWTEAVALARRHLLLDPCDERAGRIIIEGLYNLGDRTGAIRQFEHLKSILKNELNAEPGLETMKIYRRVCEDKPH
jgi:two-component SAPR family response regulator/type II secretory pathway predicted ATPase ExeA/Flp pilus assembly protein TadD